MNWRAIGLLVLTLAALLSTVMLAIAALPLLSPSLFMLLMDRLPLDLQNALFVDFLLRGGTGFWEYLVLTGALWMVRAYVAERV